MGRRRDPTGVVPREVGWSMVERWTEHGLASWHPWRRALGGQGMGLQRWQRRVRAGKGLRGVWRLTGHRARGKM